MKPSIFIFAFFSSISLNGQIKRPETSVNYFVDSLIKKGIDSILTIEIGIEGSTASSFENRWSIYVLWPEKNNYLIKKWSPTKQYKEEQVFVAHLYNYIKINSPRINSEKFKSCVLSDHHQFTIVRLRIKKNIHTFKKYDYEFSDSCPEETEYNNKLLITRMFKLFESEISFINKKITWKPL